MPDTLLEEIRSGVAPRRTTSTSSSASRYSGVKSPTEARPPSANRQYSASLQQPKSQPEWSITPQDRAKFNDIFTNLDKNQRGIIGAAEAVPFLTTSNLPEEVLAQIWDLADIHTNGQLGKDEFAIAMYLVQQKLMGRELPGSLPDSLRPSVGPTSPQSQSISQPPRALPKTTVATNSSLNDLLSLSVSPTLMAASSENQHVPTATGVQSGVSGVHAPYTPSSNFGQAITTPEELKRQSIASQGTSQFSNKPTSESLGRVTSPPAFVATTGPQAIQRLSSPPQSAPVAPTSRQISQGQQSGDISSSASLEQTKQPISPPPPKQRPISQLPTSVPQPAQRNQSSQPVRALNAQQSSQPTAIPIPAAVPVPAPQQRVSQPPPPPVQRQASLTRAPVTPHFNEKEHAIKLSALTADTSNLTTQVNTVGDLNEDAKKKLAAAQAELEEIQGLKTDLENRLIVLQGEHESELKKIEEIQGSISSLKIENEKQAAEFSELEASFNEAQANNEELQAEYQKVSTQLELDQQENLALKEKIAAILEENEALKIKLEKAQKDARQEKGLLAINKKQLGHVETEQTNTKKELDEVLKGVDVPVAGTPVNTSTLTAAPLSKDVAAPVNPISTSQIATFSDSEYPQPVSASHSEISQTAIGASIGTAVGLGGAAVLRHINETPTESFQDSTNPFGSFSGSGQDLSYTPTPAFEHTLDDRLTQLDATTASTAEPTQSSVRDTVDTPASSPPTSDYQYHPNNAFNLPLDRTQSATSSVQNNPPLSVREDIITSRPESPAIDENGSEDARRESFSSAYSDEEPAPAPESTIKLADNRPVTAPDIEGTQYDYKKDDELSSTGSFEVVPRVGSTVSFSHEDSESDGLYDSPIVPTAEPPSNLTKPSETTIDPAAEGTTEPAVKATVEPTDKPTGNTGENLVSKLPSPVVALGAGATALAASVGLGHSTAPPVPKSRPLSTQEKSETPEPLVSDAVAVTEPVKEFVNPATGTSDISSETITDDSVVPKPNVSGIALGLGPTSFETSGDLGRSSAPPESRDLSSEVQADAKKSFPANEGEDISILPSESEAENFHASSATDTNVISAPVIKVLQDDEDAPDVSHPNTVDPSPSKDVDGLREDSAPLPTTLAPTSEPIYVGTREGTPPPTGSDSTMSIQGSAPSLTGEAIPASGEFSSGAIIPDSLNDIPSERASLAPIPPVSRKVSFKGSRKSSGTSESLSRNGSLVRGHSPALIIPTAPGSKDAIDTIQTPENTDEKNREVGAPSSASYSQVSGLSAASINSIMSTLSETSAPIASAASVASITSTASIASIQSESMKSRSVIEPLSEAVEEETFPNATSSTTYNAPAISASDSSDDVNTPPVTSDGEVFNDAFSEVGDAPATSSGEPVLPAAISSLQEATPDDDTNSSVYDEAGNNAHEDGFTKKFDARNDDFDKAFANEGFALAEEEVDDAESTHMSHGFENSSSKGEHFVSASSSPVPHSYTTTPVTGIAPQLPLPVHDASTLSDVPQVRGKIDSRSVEEPQFSPPTAVTPEATSVPTPVHSISTEPPASSIPVVRDAKSSALERVITPVHTEQLTGPPSTRSRSANAFEITQIDAPVASSSTVPASTASLPLARGNRGTESEVISSYPSVPPSGTSSATPSTVPASDSLHQFNAPAVAGAKSFSNSSEPYALDTVERVPDFSSTPPQASDSAVPSDEPPVYDSPDYGSSHPYAGFGPNEYPPEKVSLKFPNEDFSGPSSQIAGPSSAPKGRPSEIQAPIEEKSSVTTSNEPNTRSAGTPTGADHFGTSAADQVTPSFPPSVPAQRPATTSAVASAIPTPAPKTFDPFEAAFDGLDEAGEDNEEDTNFDFGSATPFETAFGTSAPFPPSSSSHPFGGAATAFAPEPAPNVFDVFPTDNVHTQNHTGIPVSNEEWDSLFAGFGASEVASLDHTASQAEINSAFDVPASKPQDRSVSPNSRALNELVGMGFERAKALEALRMNNFNVENASNYLLDH